MTISMTYHATCRKNARGITDTMIDAVMNFGDKIYASHSLYYFMGQRALKRMAKVFKAPNADRYCGIVLVCDPKSNTVITCFKNANWPKIIKTKFSK